MRIFLHFFAFFIIQTQIISQTSNLQVQTIDSTNPSQFSNINLPSSNSRSSHVSPSQSKTSPTYFTNIKTLTNLSSIPQILSDLALPGYSRAHGFQILSFDGWNCLLNHSSNISMDVTNITTSQLIDVWLNPTAYLGHVFGATNKESQIQMKNLYQQANVTILLTVSLNLTGISVLDSNSQIHLLKQSTTSLLSTLINNNFDGIHLNFLQDSASNTNISSAISWVYDFLSIVSNNKSSLVIAHTINAEQFINNNNNKLITKQIIPFVDIVNVYYQNVHGQHFYEQVFGKGVFSLHNIQLILKQVSAQSQANTFYPIFLLGLTSNPYSVNYIQPNTLLQHLRKASTTPDVNTSMKGLYYDTYISQEMLDTTNEVIFRRDTSQMITATTINNIATWWPPTDVFKQLGVPTYATDHHYKQISFGVWTCGSGSLAIAKLWGDISSFLGNITLTNRNNSWKNAMNRSQLTTTTEIQEYLLHLYHSQNIRILLKVFANAESPISLNYSALACAQSLSSFVSSSGFDGVEINLLDNDGFNLGLAQAWLIEFTKCLRNKLPYHLISLTGAAMHFSSSLMGNGGYAKIHSTIGTLIDYYTVLYYDEFGYYSTPQHTIQFDTYEQVFVNSSQQIPLVSVSQLIHQGFSSSKLAIAKPFIQSQVFSGWIPLSSFRKMLVTASLSIQWAGGVYLSSYSNDLEGNLLENIRRGKNNTDQVRWTYINQIKTWWPPTATLLQMGIPMPNINLSATNSTKNLQSYLLSLPNKPQARPAYNYVAYTFWTCSEGSLNVVKLFQNPTQYLGDSIFKESNLTNVNVRKLIYEEYKGNGIKLIISLFGDSQRPITDNNYSAKYCGDKFVKSMLEYGNQIDGVDIDFQDNEAFRGGLAQDWLRILTKTLRRQLPFHHITHAPQAPYFSSDYSSKGGYLTIHREVGKHIDFYNMQYYNQLNSTYTTYQQIFLNSGTINPNNSVSELMANGIHPRKIVVGKPAQETDAYNTGYVPSHMLKSYFQRAKAEPTLQGWSPKIMLWQYLTDITGAFVTNAIPNI